MPSPLLVTITFSHYCEKARWTLDRAGITYRESGHLPAFHMLAVRRAGGHRSVPALITDEGAINDSTDIAKWADRRAPGAHLYGKNDVERREIEALEDHFDEHFGPHTRRFMYFHMLQDRDLVLRLSAMQNAPRLEKRLLPIVFPVVRPAMRRAMRITPEGAERSLRKVEAAFAEVGKKLEDGRRYLVGDTLTMADITFASLAAVVLAPPQYGAPLCSMDALPREPAAHMRAWQELPAGKFVARLFREDRAPARP
ncbi:glutathione S-transferase family protein [Polyangium jinanense]|uniref:Glutathione S-transferase n=1 Tax=Polyangium jinanense TaxID=2829994 RepID=A0A9X3XK07_9BACT|nr:glutathione S-transferase [Polyangium jinanense]MDC3957200.1 glutathione S-transferase [Polyangium jinanense]MDC3989476.1 glutathione S-transferase [Polyangium jinanense]